MAEQVSTVRLVGPVRVVHQGRNVELGGPRVRALFAYLVWRSPVPVTAPDLIDAVWGTQAPPSVKRSLTTQLAQLRKRIEPLGWRLDHSHGGYTIGFADAAVDAHELQVLASQRRTDEIDAQHAAHIAELLDRTHGVPFDGIGEPPFRAAAAAAVEVMRHSLLIHYVEAMLSTGAYHAVMERLGKSIDDEPYDEALWAGFITALVGVGRPRAALEAYETIRCRLRDDLGLMPSRVLARAGELALGIDDDPAVGTGGRLPFVGRVHERSLLVHATRSDQLCVVAVTGEPGIGKTALLGEFVGAMRRSGRDVFFGACEPSVSITLAPLVDALRGTLAAIEINTGADDDLRTREARLAYAAAEELAERARAAPMILVLDDVQWLDSVTMAALAQLSGRHATLPVTIVMAWRSTGDQVIADRIRWMTRSLGFTEVRLDPLSEHDVRNLMDHAGVAGLDAAAFVEFTGGNALFVTQMLAAPQGGRGSGGVMPTLASAIGARLAGMTPEQRDVLAVVAVLDAPGSLDLLAEVAGKAIADTAAALRELVRARILEPVAEGYQFVHGIIRETVLAETDPDLQRYLHARIVPVERLSTIQAAFHAVSAGAMLADEAAIPVIVAGAQRAASAASFAASAELWSAALARCAPDSVQWAELAPPAAAVAMMVDPGVAFDLIQRCDTLARRFERWDILANLASVERFAGVPPNGPLARAQAAKAREVFERLPPQDVSRRLEVALWIANLLLHFSPHEADDALAFAVRHADEVESRRVRDTVAFTSARFRVARDPDDAEGRSGLMELWNRTRNDDPPTAAVVGATLVTTAMRTRRPLEVDFAVIRQTAERAGDASTMTLIDVIQCACELCESSMVDAEHRINELLGDDVAPAPAKVVVNRYMLMFVLRREQLRAHEFEVMPRRHQRSGLPGLQGVPGAAAVETGDLVSARGLLDGFLAELHDLPRDWHYEGLLVLAGELACALDDPDAAALIANYLVPASGRFVMFAHTTPLGWVDTALSMLSRVAGDIDRAVSFGASARIADTGTWNGVWGGWARWAEAAALRGRDADGDVARAARLEREARATARRTGSLRLAAALRSLRKV